MSFCYKLLETAEEALTHEETSNGGTTLTEGYGMVQVTMIYMASILSMTGILAPP